MRQAESLFTKIIEALGELLITNTSRTMVCGKQFFIKIQHPALILQSICFPDPSHPEVCHVVDN